MTASAVEFVITGRLGDCLRSLFPDLEIEDHPAYTRLVLHQADQTTLLTAIATINAGPHNIDSIRTLPNIP